MDDGSTIATKMVALSVNPQPQSLALRPEAYEIREELHPNGQQKQL